MKQFKKPYECKKHGNLTDDEVMLYKNKNLFTGKIYTVRTCKICSKERCKEYAKTYKERKAYLQRVSRRKNSTENNINKLNLKIIELEKKLEILKARRDEIEQAYLEILADNESIGKF